MFPCSRREPEARGVCAHLCDVDTSSWPGLAWDCHGVTPDALASTTHSRSLAVLRVGSPPRGRGPHTQRPRGQDCNTGISGTQICPRQRHARLTACVKTRGFKREWQLLGGQQQRDTRPASQHKATAPLPGWPAGGLASDLDGHVVALASRGAGEDVSCSYGHLQWLCRPKGGWLGCPAGITWQVTCVQASKSPPR